MKNDYISSFILYLLSKFKFKQFLKKLILFNPKLFLFLKRNVYFKLSGDSKFFSRLGEIKLSKSRFYYFKFDELVVAFDSGPVNDNRGIGRVTKNIFIEISKRLSTNKIKKHKTIKVKQIEYCEFDEVDFYFFSSIHWVDEKYIAKSVIMIMDVIPLKLSDLFPEEEVVLWKEKYKIYAQNSLAIFTISNWSANEISKNLAIPKNKIYIHPLGVNFLEKNEVKKNNINIPKNPYLVYLGSNDFHKNLNIVLNALKFNDLANIKLVLIGDNESVLDKHIKKKYSNQVVLMGKLSDAETAYVISNSKALVFPSLYEGFGLPPLEAGLLGIPSICSDRPVMNEILVGGALFADPENVVEWKEKILEIVYDENLWKKTGLKAQRIARNFSWEVFFENIINNLKNLKNK